VLGMRGWPQNQREFLPLIKKLSGQYRFIVRNLRGLADSNKPFSGNEPKTIAALATMKHVAVAKQRFLDAVEPGIDPRHPLRLLVSIATSPLCLSWLSFDRVF
jgi:hypothetical protein